MCNDRIVDLIEDGFGMALYPQNRHLSPKVRAFVDFAAELYRTRDWG